MSAISNNQETTTNMEDKTTLEAIHRIMPELRESKEKLKTLREQLKDVMDQNDEYKQIAEEIKALSEKRLAAKRALLDDKDYQKISEDMDDERTKQKDLQEILSHYLVSYYQETNDTRVTDDLGETRQVILQAKVGKPEADIK
ncbi:MAG: hypothetical protein QG675_667 [Patescibacteria group bacterium]|jgi:DNA polymerase III delta prime subunit|nr:hypothetical protein [Patescibacteria group bacterium]